MDLPCYLSRRYQHPFTVVWKSFGSPGTNLSKTTRSRTTPEYRQAILLSETEYVQTPPKWKKRFIQGFSNTAEPLHKLLKKDQHYEWRKEHEEVFEELKERLTHAPILLYPDFKKKFILATDASKLGL
ncbi:4926_t:CDS:2, partial [Ambispora gerdemannii]